MEIMDDDREPRETHLIAAAARGARKTAAGHFVSLFVMRECEEGSAWLP
jgi:hypothetical protein